MPNNKAHHFVPQFYLRHFSLDQRSIGLFSLNNGQVVLRASIRGQCQRAYFYGKDGKAEAAFAGMEGAVAQVVRGIIESKRPPKPLYENHVTLMFHVVSQHARTEYAAAEHDDFSDTLAKSLLRPNLARDGIDPKDLDHVKIAFTDPVRESLRHSLPSFPMTLDLRCVVLANHTNVGFVTSDNPAVFYNQFLEERTSASNTGLQSVGLQIYLPLTPDTACFFYDPDVYGVGPTNPTHLAVKNEDADQLNRLQLLSAVESVYFHPAKNDPSALAQLYSRSKGYRRRRRMNFFSQKEHSNKPGEHRELMGFFREDIRCGFRPGFIKVLKRAARAKPELLQRIAMRDPELCRAHEQFLEQAREGKRDEGDLPRFLHEFIQSRIERRQ